MISVSKSKVTQVCPHQIHTQERTKGGKKVLLWYHMCLHNVTSQGPGLWLWLTWWGQECYLLASAGSRRESRHRCLTLQ